MIFYEIPKKLKENTPQSAYYFFYNNYSVTKNVVPTNSTLLRITARKGTVGTIIHNTALWTKKVRDT